MALSGRFGERAGRGSGMFTVLNRISLPGHPDRANEDACGASQDAGDGFCINSEHLFVLAFIWYVVSVS